MQLKLIALTISIFLSASSQATIVSASFPSLEGKYTFFDDPRSAPFDLGVLFSSIASAAIEVTAIGTAGTQGLCLVLFNAPPCGVDGVALPASFYAFRSEDLPNSIATGAISTSTTGITTESKTLSNTDLFLNGQGTLEFAHDYLGLETGQAIFLEPTITVSDITLTVDGVVAPTSEEPVVPVPTPTPNEPIVPVPAPTPDEPIVPIPAPSPEEPVAPIPAPIPAPTPGVTAVPIPLSLPLFSSALTGLLLLSNRKRD